MPRRSCEESSYSGESDASCQCKRCQRNEYTKPHKQCCDYYKRHKTCTNKQNIKYLTNELDEDTKKCCKTVVITIN